MRSVAGVSVNIRVNLDYGNVDEVLPLVDLLVEHGVVDQKSRRLHLAPVQDWKHGGCMSYSSSCLMSPQEFGVWELRLNEQVFKRYGFEIVFFPGVSLRACSAVTPYSYVVGPRGELYKCWTDVGIDRYVIGNIRLPRVETPLSLAYTSSTPFNTRKCRACSVLPLCAGGCPSKPLRGIETISQHYCAKDRFVLTALLRQQIRHRLREGLANA
jgi:uncharacterized protein